MNGHQVSPNDAASPTALWACGSWFCQHRGPFWVKSLTDAKSSARAHAERKFLGIWNHRAMACSLHDKRVGELLRKLPQGTHRPT